jgi:DNA helicase IV
MRIVVMGVAGSGKTTVGLRIAAALGKEDKMNHTYAFFKGTSNSEILIIDPSPSDSVFISKQFCSERIQLDLGATVQ